MLTWSEIWADNGKMLRTAQCALGVRGQQGAGALGVQQAAGAVGLKEGAHTTARWEGEGEDGEVREEGQRSADEAKGPEAEPSWDGVGEEDVDADWEEEGIDAGIMEGYGVCEGQRAGATRQSQQSQEEEGEGVGEAPSSEKERVECCREFLARAYSGGGPRYPGLKRPAQASRGGPAKKATRLCASAPTVPPTAGSAGSASMRGAQSEKSEQQQQQQQQAMGTQMGSELLEGGLMPQVR